MARFPIHFTLLALILAQQANASLFEGPGVFNNNNNNNNNQTLSNFNWSDYTLRVVAPPDYFKTFNAPLVFVNDYTGCNGMAECMLDACNFEDRIHNELAGNIVLVTTKNCELARVMEQVFDAGAISILQLYAAHSSFEPNDDSYAPHMDPARVVRESRGTFHVQRLRGIEPAQFLSQIIGCVPMDGETVVKIRGALAGTTIHIAKEPTKCTVPLSFAKDSTSSVINMTVIHEQDPWNVADTTPVRYFEKIYVLVSNLIIIGFTVQALYTLSKHPERRRKNANGAPSAYTLQVAGLCLCLLIFVFRIIEVSWVTCRIMFYIWTTPLVDDMLFTWSLSLICVVILMLILYWIELLNVGKSSARFDIRTRNKTMLFVFSGLLMLFTTYTQIASYLSKSSGWYAVILQYAVLIGVGLCESIGMLIVGGNVIHKLKQANNVALDRGEVSTNSQTLRFTMLVVATSQYIVVLVVEIGIVFGLGLQYYPSTSVYLAFFGYFFETLFLGGMVIFVFRPSKTTKKNEPKAPHAEQRFHENQQKGTQLSTVPDAIAISTDSSSIDDSRNSRFVAGIWSSAYVNTSRLDDSRDSRFVPDSSWMDGTRASQLIMSVNPGFR